MVGRDSSDDELHAWFVEAVSTPERPARESTDGVVEVRVSDSSGRRRRVELLLTREQLRAHAWSDYEMIDAYQGTSDVLAADPVRAGVEALAMYAAKELADLLPDETHVVLIRRRFIASVRAELPPVAGRQPLVKPGGEWMSHRRDGDPPGRFGPYLADHLAAEDALERTYAAAQPTLHPGSYALTTARSVSHDVTPVLTVQEPEGVSFVVPQEEADRLGLPYSAPVAIVTLQVRATLTIVGVTEDIARTLSRWQIPCSVVAGFLHDHVLVPAQHGEKAVGLLAELTSSA